MKRILLTAAALAVSAGVVSVVKAQDLTIRLSHPASLIHPAHRHAELFKEAVERRSGRKVEIRIFGNRQLGGDRETVEAVRAGTIDCSINSSVLFPLVVGKVAFDALQLPFLVDTYEHQAQMYQSPVAQQMLDNLETVGLKGLSYSDGGLRHFLNRSGFVTSLADFNGLKTRIVPVPLHKRTWEAVGSNPVGVAYAEVYTALQTGVIDAVEFNLSSIKGENVYEIAKYVTLTGHYFWPQVMTCNLEKFNSWSDEVQANLVESGREIIGPVVEYAANQDRELRSELQNDGVEIREFGELDQLRETVRPIIEEWAQKDPLIQAYIEHARQLR